MKSSTTITTTTLAVASPGPGVGLRPRAAHGLTIPAAARGLILLAQRPGSQADDGEVAAALQAHRLATLELALLFDAEAEVAGCASDIGLLGSRWSAAIAWTRSRPELARLPLGLFGEGVDAAGALSLASGAAGPGARVAAVVSVSGSFELLGDGLDQIHAPTLLLVGADDPAALARNRHALQRLRCRKRLEVVPGAGPLFDSHGALEVVAALAAEWFETHLTDPHWA